MIVSTIHIYWSYLFRIQYIIIVIVLVFQSMLSSHCSHSITMIIHYSPTEVAWFMLHSYPINVVVFSYSPAIVGSIDHYAFSVVCIVILIGIIQILHNSVISTVHWHPSHIPHCSSSIVQLSPYNPTSDIH